MKVVLGATRSREEIKQLGIDEDSIPKMTERVQFVVEEVQNAKSAAADLVQLRLRSKKENLEKQIKEKETLVQKKQEVWSENTLTDIQESVETLKSKAEELENLINPDTCYLIQKKQQMLKRQASSLMEDNRLKRRKLSNQGRKQMLDEEDEYFIAKAIEDKASYHGRRHDTVMYTNNKRVKKKNILSIANYRLFQRGKKLIRSATTVYNRARPKNKRTIQAKRQLGKGLFCWKKPPKGEECSNENTHYQRAHVKNIKRRFFSAKSSETKKFCFMRSTDDKAYLRPGTSEGFEKARNIRILTVSDEEKARQLPKYDWPEKLVYVTPGSHIIFTKSSIH